MNKSDKPKAWVPLPSMARTGIALSHDIVWAIIIWLGCYWLRQGQDYGVLWFNALTTAPLAVGVEVLCFISFGLYRGIWRYSSITDLKRIALAIGTAALIIPTVMLLWRGSEGVPRTVYLLNPLLLLLAMCTGRMFYRWWKEERPMAHKRLQGKPVILLAADGNELLSVVNSFRRSTSWALVCILEEGMNAHGREIAGVPVLRGWKRLPEMADQYKAAHVILVDVSSDHNRRREAYELCETANAKLLLLPRVEDYMSGRVRISSLREVELDDLLGRDPVALDSEQIDNLVRNEVVLVTGAGGSIGSELCRQIASRQPALLVLFELSEFSLYALEQQLELQFPGVSIKTIIGDVKDSSRLRQLLLSYRPTVIFHAAAYKHVPLMERDNAWETVLNNALGTLRLAETIAAVRDEVKLKRLVFISTDKAVNPSSVMGASKRLSEMLLQIWSTRTGIAAVTVRFGNVLGSTGSVIPKFRQQIARGGPITVTHPEVRRYFMSIQEACGLVLQSAVMGAAHEIFVLEMGEPVRIVDLAKDLIRLSGYREEEIGIEFNGLRPGEKLFEELLTDSEHTLKTRHAKVRVARYSDLPDAQWEAEVRQWLNQPGKLTDIETRRGLARFIPEYQTMEQGANLIELHPSRAAMLQSKS
jgi:FlaA1/EpsC-like NDP-sugar epimerase